VIGQSLGVYQIVAKLGEGGMGEVYRARDTRLARDVAIKVLPQAFAADPERLARFEREARTLAALNHPNIAHVHGITDSPIALVMELVDGEDLSARIARGPLPIEDAVAIARQLVDALEAAHDQGIVHRDLKPANIKIRADGTVKVLDFGLARSTATVAEADSAAMHSPTFTSPAMTQFGMILGTAAYMAPEQARGRPADRRVDIWAFGCVLYEMLTGTSPFGGEDVSLVLATILKEDADFTRLPPATPAGLRRLFRRCLEKDPKRRLSAIADARFDLDDPGTEPLPSVAPSRKSLAWPWIAAALVVGVGISWLVFGRARGVESRPAIDGMMRQVTEMPGAESEPHISPDGRQIVFSSNAGGHWDVYLLRVGGSRAINLTADSPADDRQPAFSPDGQQIAFRSERGGGGIFVMGATGESVRRVTAAGFDPAWSPDGRSLVYSTEPVDNPYERNIQAEIWVAEIASGKTRRLTTTDGIQPTWSPDGRHIAYWTNKAGQRDIVTVAADGGTPTDVTNDAATDWSPEWSPDSRWLYFSSDRGGQMNLWRVPMNTAGRPAGPP
jgi:hypothetical protein